MSTLVETVSIDCANFHDSFLTCSTCLCGYDSASKSPKLLPCSHTVCLCCLEKIVMLPGGATTPQFSCPNCREIVQVPNPGGVASLPPSFLVNQLLDLMNQESRRDRIPHCGIHSGHGELLLCETCDVVFCSSCTDNELQSLGDGSLSESANHSNSSRHTVIPFGVAIKRMSEILLYKEYICKRNLDQAAEAVEVEIAAVDRSAIAVEQKITESFNDVQKILDERKTSIKRDLQHIVDEKRRVLRGQLQIIESERTTINQHSNNGTTQLHMQHPSNTSNSINNSNDKSKHHEVRASITKHISSLNDKLDIWRTLSSPRDNAYIRFDVNSSLPIRPAMDSYGCLHTSSTFPAMSTVRIVEPMPLPCHLSSRALVQTINYNGEKRTKGDDPVRAELSLVKDMSRVVCKVIDHANGLYSIIFTPTEVTTHRLNVRIFDHSIDGSPLTIKITDQHSPVLTIGEESRSRCSASLKPGRESLFQQPVSMCLSHSTDSACLASPGGVANCRHAPFLDDSSSQPLPPQQLYVLDSANAKISIFNVDNGNMTDEIHLPKPDTSYTGVTTTRDGNLAVVNWRQKKALIISVQGTVLVDIDYPFFQEPTVITSSSDINEIYVGDNSARSIFVFDSLDGTPKRTIKSKDQTLFKQITSLCCYTDQLIVADSNRLRIYTLDGAFIRTMDMPNGRYSCICVDHCGRCCAVRTERGSITIRVFKPLPKTTEQCHLAANNHSNLVNTDTRTLPRGDSFNSKSMSFSRTLPATSSLSLPTHLMSKEHIYDMNSEAAKLKRPSDIVCTSNGHLFVSDLSQQCIRKYRYL